MKTIWLLLLAGLAAEAGCSVRDVPTTEPSQVNVSRHEPRATAESHPHGPRFKVRVVCFLEKIDSSSYCGVTNFQPNGVVHRQGKLTCGWPGKVSETEWSFVERKAGADVYQFTRRFPVDGSPTRTTTRTVEFDNARAIVFQDESQVIVLEPRPQ